MRWVILGLVTLAAIAAFVVIERRSRVSGAIDWGKVAARSALLLALYATLVPIIFNVFPAGGPATPTPQPSGTTGRVEAAERISACETAHGIPKADHVEYVEGVPVRFMHCEWPPSPLADADGYWEIRVLRVEGPGEDEASGASQADRITGPCATFQLTYDYGHMGNARHLQPFRMRPGEIYVAHYDAGGVRWTGDRTRLPFYPARDEAVVLANGSYVIAGATCVTA